MPRRLGRELSAPRGWGGIQARVNILLSPMPASPLPQTHARARAGGHGTMLQCRRMMGLHGLPGICALDAQLRATLCRHLTPEPGALWEFGCIAAVSIPGMWLTSTRLHRGLHVYLQGA